MDVWVCRQDPKGKDKDKDKGRASETKPKSSFFSMV